MEKSLKGSCIFDHTTDQQLIEKTLGIPGITKEQYLDYVSERAMILDLLHFAELTGNKELEAQIEREFGNKIRLFFNE